jgi:hypothetical protein
MRALNRHRRENYGCIRSRVTYVYRAVDVYGAVDVCIQSIHVYGAVDVCIESSTYVYIRLHTSVDVCIQSIHVHTSTALYREQYMYTGQ